MVSVPCSCSAALCSFMLCTDSNQPGSLWGGGEGGKGGGSGERGGEGGHGISRLFIWQLVGEEAKPLP